MTDKSPKSEERESGRIKSVEIGYRVLLAVQMGPGSVRLSDVARRASLSGGAAHNYLVSLVRTGLVEQDGRGRYRLGPSAFALSLASFRQLNGFDVLRGEANALRQLTSQTISVGVWSQAGPVSIYMQRGPDKEALEFRPGLFPVLTSGAGAIFIAYLPEPDTRDVIARELEELPSKRIRQETLSSIRDAVSPKGYARINRKDSPGVTLSAPVWGIDGKIQFTLSIVVHNQIEPKVEARWLHELLASSHRASLLLSESNFVGFSPSLAGR